MYPAGRILHLVPAFLVFSEEELGKLGKPCSQPASEQMRLHVPSQHWLLLAIRLSTGAEQQGFLPPAFSPITGSVACCHLLCC